MSSCARLTLRARGGRAAVWAPRARADAGTGRGGPSRGRGALLYSGGSAAVVASIALTSAPMAVPVGQGAPDQENRPPQPFSWAQRRRNDKRDLDEFQRVEQLVTRSAAPKRPAAAQRPRPEGLVHRFYQTASSSVPAPDDVRGLVPGLESRRELNAATKAELGRLRAKVGLHATPRSGGARLM